MVRKTLWAAIALIVFGGFVFVTATGCGDTGVALDEEVGQSRQKSKKPPILLIDTTKETFFVKKYAREVNAKWISSTDRRTILAAVEGVAKNDPCLIYFWSEYDIFGGGIKLPKGQVLPFSELARVAGLGRRVWVFDLDSFPAKDSRRYFSQNPDVAVMGVEEAISFGGYFFSTLAQGASIYETLINRPPNYLWGSQELFRWRPLTR